MSIIRPHEMPAVFASSIEGRCLRNEVAEGYAALDTAALADDSYGLSEPAAEEIRALEDRILAEILRDTSRANSDESVYVGGPGVAYLLVKAAVLRGDADLLARAQGFLDPWDEPLRESAAEEPDLACSLLCGRAGWLCIEALRRQASGDRDGASRVAEEYSRLACTARSLETLDADEWLYGRAGFLHGCLLLRHFLGAQAVPDATIHAIAEAMLTSGLAYAALKSEQGEPAGPLLWRWHGKEYLGAAHGVMGIVFMLLHVETVTRDANRRQLLAGTIDWLLTKTTAIGNYPKALGSSDPSNDCLVHFCHGAPGAVQLLCKAHDVFGAICYLEAAVATGQCVWRFGMLKKGPGLCHGFSGNAYSFLTLFRATRDPSWLARAHHYAATMLRPDVVRQCRQPDNPLSLFEGLAGAACFLLDLRLAPAAAAFPLYEVGGLGICFSEDDGHEATCEGEPSRAPAVPWCNRKS